MKFLYISTTVVETVPLLQQATISIYLTHVGHVVEFQSCVSLVT